MSGYAGQTARDNAQQHNGDICEYQEVETQPHLLGTRDAYQCILTSDVGSRQQLPRYPTTTTTTPRKQTSRPQQQAPRRRPQRPAPPHQTPSRTRRRHRPLLRHGFSLSQHQPRLHRPAPRRQTWPHSRGRGPNSKRSRRARMQHESMRL